MSYGSKGWILMIMHPLILIKQNIRNQRSTNNLIKKFCHFTSSLEFYWNCDKWNSYNIILMQLNDIHTDKLYKKINCSKIGNIIRSDIEDRLMKVLRYVNVIVKVYQTIIHIKSSSKSNIRPFFRYQQYLRSIEYFLSSIRTIM